MVHSDLVGGGGGAVTRAQIGNYSKLDGPGCDMIQHPRETLVCRLNAGCQNSAESTWLLKRWQRDTV